MNPEFVPAQVNVALHLESVDKVDEAIDLYLSALRTRPDLPEVHYNLGNALLKKRLYEQATESYREALRLAPGHAAAHRNLGLALGRLNRPCDAVQHLERSAQLPGSTAADALLHREISRLRAACDM
jgi:tetratricopeptide (TPR) repeat protein